MIKGKHAREGSKMKKRLLLVSMIAICMALMAGGSLAYFTAQEKAHNVITSGGVDIVLNEWADEEKTQRFEDVDGVMPGTSVTKIVEVENTGQASAWVRVSVDQAIALENGSGATAEEIAKVLSIDFNTTDWELNGDWWYYKYELPSGQVTSPLFKHVSFDGPEMGNLYQASSVTIDVAAQAVQVANNGESATAATGWPIG